MAEGSRLVMTQGPQPGQTFTLNQDTQTIGRDPSNPIEISDPQISRQHARITRQGGMMILEDLGSTNGTFVNGMRLTSPHALSSGDVIGLGDAVTLTFYGVGTSATETIVGRPTVSGPQPPPPEYEPAGPQPAPTPPPPGPATYTPPPVTAPPPVEEEPPDRRWIWFGCGCLTLLLIGGCIGVFILDYMGMLPPLFYEPLRWLGFF
jgi:hypothetical protein